MMKTGIVLMCLAVCRSKTAFAQRLVSRTLRIPSGAKQKKKKSASAVSKSPISQTLAEKSTNPSIRNDFSQMLCYFPQSISWKNRESFTLWGHVTCGAAARPENRFTSQQLGKPPQWIPPQQQVSRAQTRTDVSTKREKSDKQRREREASGQSRRPQTNRDVCFHILLLKQVLDGEDGRT